MEKVGEENEDVEEEKKREEEEEGEEEEKEQEEERDPISYAQARTQIRACTGSHTRIGIELVGQT